MLAEVAATAVHEAKSTDAETLKLVRAGDGGTGLFKTTHRSGEEKSFIADLDGETHPSTERGRLLDMTRLTEDEVEFLI